MSVVGDFVIIAAEKLDEADAVTEWISHLRDMTQLCVRISPSIVARNQLLD